MLVIYRDDGFWTLLWLALSFHLRPLRNRSSLPPGFVAQVSGSFPDIVARSGRPRSIHLHRVHFTQNARLWRLTLAWGDPIHAQRAENSGASSGGNGNCSPGDGGGAISQIKPVLS